MAGGQRGEVDDDRIDGVRAGEQHQPPFAAEAWGGGGGARGPRARGARGRSLPWRAAYLAAQAARSR
jgi:hypothetical protein